MNTDFKNKGVAVDAKDGLGQLIRIPAGVFEKLGKDQSYKVVTHSDNGVITGKNGNKYRFINAVLNEKGLVTYLVDADEKIVAGKEVILTYAGLSDAGFAQFNVLSELPTS